MALKDDSNNWVFEETDLLNLALDFFSNLYKDDMRCYVPFKHLWHVP